MNKCFRDCDICAATPVAPKGTQQLSCTSYACQTIDSPNPFARFAHRSRLRKSLALALSRIGPGSKVLDYGCGSGIFVSALLALNSDAVGYEPFKEERCKPALPVFSRLQDVEALGPYDVITLLETIEHLHDHEIDEFLRLSERVLRPGAGVLISAPIEIGPALLLKELSRYLRAPSGRLRGPFDHSAGELLKAAFLGISARRAENIKIAHRGFDFRRAIEYIREKGWRVQVLSHGPLPIGGWYGNSQVFLWASRPGSAATPLRINWHRASAAGRAK